MKQWNWSCLEIPRKIYGTKILLLGLKKMECGMFSDSKQY